MKKLGLCCAALSVLLSSASAPAWAMNVAEPQDDDEPIIVTGVPEKEIADFVGALTPRSIEGQLSRFEHDVCPVAAGMVDAQNVAVAQRMRKVAEAAGLKLGAVDCRPNVLLIVTDNKREAIIALAKEYPGMSRDQTSSEWRALLNSKEPAVAWHLQGPPINMHGAELSERSEDFYVNRTSGSASRISPMTHPQFSGAVVVVDSKAITGLTTTQIADYAAMRAYLDSDPEKLAASNIPSILKILDAAPDAEVPVTLTQWDMEALRSFYKADRNIAVAAQRTDMRKQLKDRLGQDELAKN